MTTEKHLGWFARETLGIATPNPGTVVKMPITPEMREQLQARADAAGMTLDEYLDHLFAEFADSEEDGDAEA